MFIKKEIPLVLVLLCAFIFCRLALADKGYEGYQPALLDAAPWYNGVKATIDYKDTTVGCIRTVAWDGIDDSGHPNTKWIQGGWQKNHGGDAEIYWEYTDKNGQWQLGTGVAPAATETYEQYRDDDQVKWQHGDTVYKTMAWNLFDTIEFKKAYFGTEMHDTPSDHTPGGT